MTAMELESKNRVYVSADYFAGKEPNIYDRVYFLEARLSVLESQLKPKQPRPNHAAQILGFIQADTKPVSIYEIEKGTGISNNVIRTTCTRLLNAGKIARALNEQGKPRKGVYGRV